MSDTERRLADIEKRLARLEKLTEKPAVNVGQFAVDREFYTYGGRFCPCGRDVCRAPDCPTHKKGGA